MSFWSTKDYNNAILFLEEDTSIHSLNLLVQLPPAWVTSVPTYHYNTKAICQEVFTKLRHQSHGGLSQLSISFSSIGLASGMDGLLANCLSNTKISHIAKLTLRLSGGENPAVVLQGVGNSTFHLESLSLYSYVSSINCTPDRTKALVECLLNKKSSLRHLEVGCISIRSDAEACALSEAISQLQLKSFAFRSPRECNGHMLPLWKGISKIHSLEQLQISEDNLVSSHFSVLPNLVNLKRLKIKCDHSDRGMIAKQDAIHILVNRCPALETLETSDRFHSLDLSIALAKNRMRFNSLVQGNFSKPLWPLILARQTCKMKFDSQANLQVLFQFLKESNPDFVALGHCLGC